MFERGGERSQRAKKRAGKKALIDCIFAILSSTLETAQKRTENQHRQLALLAKQLRLVLVAQQYLETGGVEGLLATLKDLERP